MMPKERTGRGRLLGVGAAAAATILASTLALGAWASPLSGPAASAPWATGAAGASSPPSPIGSAASAIGDPAGGSASPGRSAPAPSPDPSADAARLQRVLDALRAKLSIPGVSAALLWDDGQAWVGASGLRNVAADDPMTTGTAFALASVSKTFTAAVVLQLVEEGRLTLDQPVAPLLPAYRLDRRITVRMLLDHTSGLTDFFLGKGIDAALQKAPDATWTPPRSWRYVPRPLAVPGRAWIYSNTNYLLLGELVGAVTGHPLAEEVRTRLLDPLGLATAWYQAVETPRAAGALGYLMTAKAGGGWNVRAVAEPSGVMPFRSVVTAAGGAGSIAATALDAARWMRAWAGGQVLDPTLQAAMLADVTRTVKLHARIPYGLGIQRITIDGRVALGHSGRFLGMRGDVRYLPALGITIAVLTNQSALDPIRLSTQLLRVVAPTPAPSVPAPAPTSSTGPTALPS